jgi:ABC-type branched-subunit amino acid transport system ATPase component
LLRPYRGKINFAGRDLTRAGTAELVSQGLALVPQGRHLFAGLTVRENLLQGAYSRRDANIRADLDMVLELFPALQRRLNAPAGKLSGGEQQMAAIGRGIMARPKLLMIDELSLGLAPIVVDAMIAAVEQINRKQGTALLIVEQDVQVALEHAQRGYVLENGRIVLSDTASNLLGNMHVRAAYMGV